MNNLTCRECAVRNVRWNTWVFRLHDLIHSQIVGMQVFKAWRTKGVLAKISNKYICLALSRRKCPMTAANKQKVMTSEGRPQGQWVWEYCSCPADGSQLKELYLVRWLNSSTKSLTKIKGKTPMRIVTVTCYQNGGQLLNVTDIYIKIWVINWAKINLKKTSHMIT